MIEFSQDESRVTICGHHYRTAQPLEKRMVCTGCEMKKGFGCRLVEAVKQSRCQPKERADQRQIIWVRDL